jgi:hypothetical protein
MLNMLLVAIGRQPNVRSRGGFRDLDWLSNPLILRGAGHVIMCILRDVAI